MINLLKYCIGLSRTTPALATAQQIEETTSSASGLYLEELPKLEWLKDLSINFDYTATGYYTLLKEAREEAIKETKLALLGTLRTLAKLKYKPFAGAIGENGIKGYLPYLPGEAVTLAINTKQIDSAFLKITKIALLTDVPGEMQLTLPDAAGTVIGVSTAATPIYTTLPEPLLLPLNGSSYQFSYQAPEARVVNNSLSCGCSALDKLIPTYIGAANNAAQGLAFVAEMACKEDEVILLNYKASETLASYIAHTIRYKAAELLVEKLLSSGAIHRDTMLSTEARYGDRNHFRAKFDNYVMWLAGPEGIDLSLDSCYFCGTQKAPIRTTTIYS